MLTIGKLIKETRVQKRYSLKKVEGETKIKREFIWAIEKEDWKNLPEFPVVTGFVKNLASYLGINEKKALAILRRDYPPTEVPINPKPDVEQKLIWSPRLTFLIGIGLVLIVILGYLGFQYQGFIRPPSLIVNDPRAGEVINKREIRVSGRTDTDATITANSQPILVNEDGDFEGTIGIFEETFEVIIKATSRSGKESTVRRKIIPEL